MAAVNLMRRFAYQAIITLSNDLVAAFTPVHAPRVSFDYARIRTASDLLLEADNYVKNLASPSCSALLLNRVALGRPGRMVHNFTNLTAPPPGYDSVAGEPGFDLNYEECVVYNDDAIRPNYLIVYTTPEGKSDKYPDEERDDVINQLSSNQWAFTGFADEYAFLREMHRAYTSLALGFRQSPHFN
ncbi:uncharacterized protein FIBRA_08672 [Fibroporia radiculosa]|uniref:Uncharacterized protein n=1 Tax=Fibroporia radiculosa TaxID=599839 RepID=J4ICH3_9APHY|nr:uncharacterized protein FIBRA_08672 [Fibroporia radiculosa]CCM06411.1 predicted protein [Fibroporia radiculosa]